MVRTRVYPWLAISKPNLRAASNTASDNSDWSNTIASGVARTGLAESKMHSVSSLLQQTCSRAHQNHIVGSSLSASVSITKRLSLWGPRYQQAQPVRASSTSKDDQEVSELLKAADALMQKLGSPELHSAISQHQVEEEEVPQRVMKLVCDVNGCIIVPVAASPSKVHGPEGSFVGSSGQSVSEANRPRDFLLSEGEGWKLGYDRNPASTASFTALLGSDTWSVSLTKHEFTDFVNLLRKLQRSIATLQTCGEWGGTAKASDVAKGSGSKTNTQPSESTLELQTQRIWMQARAPQKQLFDLTRLFQQGLKKGGRPQAAFHLRFIVMAPEGERQREFEGQYAPEAVMRLLEHLESYPPAVDGADEEQPLEGFSGSGVASYIG